MKNTPQQNFWSSGFGREYTDRNPQAADELDRLYLQDYGVSRSAMNKEFLSGLSLGHILEVGCNVGSQLGLLQAQGYADLWGLELQDYAVEKAKTLTKSINIIKGSAFDIPFKDGYFDLVFTSGVLIHINPDDINEALKEIYRVAKKYIWGFEYFDENYHEVEYRGNKNCLWKGNFAQRYLDLFPNLKRVKTKDYKYINSENVDQMFLLEK